MVDLEGSLMPEWRGSERRKQLPPNWETEIRPAVLDRDGHRCTYTEHGDRCPNRTNLQVDHVRRGNCHELWNLTTLCGFHHQIKSSQEGREALAKKEEKIKAKFRRTEQHPSSW